MTRDDVVVVPLPCPFCGGDSGYSVEGFVFCRSCASEGPEASIEGEPGMARRDAVALWNTRASPSASADRGGLREKVIQAVRPELDRWPMVDASQTQLRNIRAGWIADAVLALLPEPPALQQKGEDR